MSSNVVIVGVGSLASAVASRIHESTDYQVGLVVDTSAGNRGLESVAEQTGSPYLLAPTLKNAELLARIRELQPAYIFSADNLRIFSPELLKLATVACINFHNGPLPDYRGVNIPTWVIWNGETEHSVTWHIMLEEVDAGGAMLRRAFALDERETAFSLSMKCIQAGIDSVPTLIEMLPDLDTSHITPPASAGRYFARSSLPNDGILDSAWSATELDRLFRAMHYRTIPNYAGTARLAHGGKLLDIKTLKLIDASGGKPQLRDNQLLLERFDGMVLVTLAPASR